jgi:LytS/YehU family sensor histidine kinase
MFVVYWTGTPHGAPPFWTAHDRMIGFSGLSFLGVLFAPWVALIALVRQKDVLVREQTLQLQLQRSELERQSAESRLRLLQAQVEPHFLFNTLANVRELVQEGSPQASAVLDSLIAYLRAAVPRLHDPATTLGQELELVRAYLEVMQMRMPDRLEFELHADEAARALRCPPLTLLTLVENAVRHGIDPSEDGGRIDVRARVEGGRCRASVCDTGVGTRTGRPGLGTGLATLRERLQLVFGSDAQLSIAPLLPRGTCAEVEFPAQPVAT